MMNAYLDEQYTSSILHMYMYMHEVGQGVWQGCGRGVAGVEQGWSRGLSLGMRFYHTVFLHNATKGSQAPGKPCRH